MSYIFYLRGGNRRIPVDIENIMDTLIESPFVEIKNPVVSRKLGVYTKELKKYNLLEIKSGRAFLKVNNYLKPKSVFKIKKLGFGTGYIFKDLEI